MIHNQIGLNLARALHAILLFLMAASIPYILLNLVCWLAFPLTFLIVNFIWAGGALPLTDLENSFREKLSLPKIRCFIGYYFKFIIK
jgi:hypothetical protein